MLTVNGLSSYNPRPCSNCGTENWKSKNDRYCNHCAGEYLDAYCKIICQRPNPIQSFVDLVFDNYEKDV